MAAIVVGVLVLLSAARADVCAQSTTEDKPWQVGTTPEARQAARDHFLEGNQHFAERAYAQAAEKYRAAIALLPHPAFHFNLGVVELELAASIAAYGSFQQALRYGEEPLGKENYEQALAHVRSLEEKLVRVEITCDQADAEVSLNDKPLAGDTGRYRSVVMPGVHRLMARKDGFLPEQQQFEGAAGAKVEIAFRMRPAPQDELVVDVRRKEPVRRWSVWKPWLVSGAGALMVVGAVYLDRKTSADFDRFDRDFERICPSFGCFDAELPPDLSNRLEDARMQQKVALGTYVIGGAFLGTGAVMAILDHMGSGGSETDSAPSGPGLSLTPTVTAHGASICVKARF